MLGIFFIQKFVLPLQRCHAQKNFLHMVSLLADLQRVTTNC